jgi:uncharacterized protein (UPF0332 family)
MTGREFIQAAGRWASQANDIASIRTAISRAYYGAFHLSRDLLTADFAWRCRGGNDHQWVQRHFLHCGDVDAQLAGRLLVALHDHRKLADYDLAERRIESPATALSCVDMAIDVQTYLDRLSADEVARLRTDMQRYREAVGLT